MICLLVESIPGSVLCLEFCPMRNFNRRTQVISNFSSEASASPSWTPHSGAVHRVARPWLPSFLTSILASYLKHVYDLMISLNKNLSIFNLADMHQLSG